MSDDKKWGKLREAGRASFVLRYGVLAWGVTTGLLFTLVRVLEEGAEANVPLTLVSSMLLFPLGGVLWGHAMWWFCEKLRRRRVS